MTQKKYNCFVSFKQNIFAQDLEDAIRKIERMKINKLGSDYPDLDVHCIEIPKTEAEKQRDITSFLAEGIANRKRKTS